MMTRKEAIDIIENKIQIDVRFCTKEEVEQYQEALGMALSALRPVSREQVERMRGEWRSIHGLSEYYCSRCGEEFEIHAYDKGKYRFCSHCMAPMTDEAVEMVMERMETIR